MGRGRLGGVAGASPVVGERAGGVDGNAGECEARRCLGRKRGRCGLTRALAGVTACPMLSTRMVAGGGGGAGGGAAVGGGGAGGGEARGGGSS